MPRPVGNCKALMPCSRCCNNGQPGISNYYPAGTAINFSFDSPLMGLSGSVSITSAPNLFPELDVVHLAPGVMTCPDRTAAGCALIVDTPPTCKYCCTPGKRGCCDCGCRFGMPTNNGSCADLYHCTPTDNWPQVGGDWSIVSVGFGCDGLRGIFTAQFSLQCCSGACDPATLPLSGLDFAGSTIDAGSFKCKCPDGLYVKWNGIGSDPGFPGAPTDPDGTVIVEAAEPTCGGDLCPCPDRYPCPDFPMASMMRTATRNPSGLLVSGAPSGPGMSGAVLLGQSNPGRVGTNIKKLLVEYKLTSSVGCGCDAFAAEVDSWGVEQCRQRRDEIVAHLEKHAGQTSWGKKLRAGWLAWRKGLPLTIPDLVDEAIQLAENPHA